MPRPPDEQLPIRTVARLTGVNPVTLRAWERRHGLFQPVRTSKGHRLYTHEHVELVRRVLALVDRGVPISRVREHLDAGQSPAATASGSLPAHRCVISGRYSSRRPPTPRTATPFNTSSTGMSRIAQAI